MAKKELTTKERIKRLEKVYLDYKSKTADIKEELEKIQKQLKQL